MNENATIGKKRLLLIIIAMLIMPIILMPLSKHIKGMEANAFNLLSYMFFLILYFYLYRGNDWAKRITIVLTSLSAITYLVVFFMTFSFTALNLLLIVLAIFYGFIADQLIRSDPINAYFECCKIN